MGTYTTKYKHQNVTHITHHLTPYKLKNVCKLLCYAVTICHLMFMPLTYKAAEQELSNNFLDSVILYGGREVD